MATLLCGNASNLARQVPTLLKVGKPSPQSNQKVVQFVEQTGEQTQTS